MNILVCVKQVPDTTEIKINPETNTLIRDGVPSILNPFDAFALETALRLKEAHAGKVTVISMGPPQAMAILKEALSVGADDVYLISDRAFGGSDTLATSYILSTAMKYLQEKSGEKFDAILCGKQAIDGDTAQVGPEMAEHLGIAQVTYATEVNFTDGKFSVRQDADSGYNIMEAAAPVMISVTKPQYDMRFPTVKAKLAANRATIETITSAELEGQIDMTRCGLKGSPTKVKKTFTPSVKKSGVVLKDGDAAEFAAQLVTMLKDAGTI